MLFRLKVKNKMSNNKVEISRLISNHQWWRLDIKVYFDDKKLEKRVISFGVKDEDKSLEELWESCSEVTNLKNLKSRIFQSFLEMRKYNKCEDMRTIYFEPRSSCSKSGSNEKPATNTSKDDGNYRTEENESSIDIEEAECSQGGCVGSLSTKKEDFDKNFLHVLEASRNVICSNCRKKL